MSKVIGKNNAQRCRKNINAVNINEPSQLVSHVGNKRRRSSSELGLKIERHLHQTKFDVILNDYTHGLTPHYHFFLN